MLCTIILELSLVTTMLTVNERVAYTSALRPPALSLTLTGITGELRQPPKIDLRALVVQIMLYLFMI